MRIRTLGVALATLGAAAFCAASPALAAKETEPLLQYVVKGDVDPEELAKAGFDMRESHVTGKEGFHIVATPSQAADLDAKGAEVVRLQKGAVARTFQAPNPLAQPTHGYDVFRPWSLEPAPCPTGCTTPLMPLSEWYDQQARENRDIVRKYVYGQSLLGQDLVAYRLTADDDDDDDDDDRRRGRGDDDDDDDEGRDKPVVLYNAVQHAREWIAAETNRRLFEYMLDNKRNRASGIPRLLDSTEVWFVPIVNPDGYDYTFVRANTRMWRKNLRDNDDDGQITAVDGVDPNRNWPTKWRFDPEGASDNFASETYRGTAPASEPEVAAYERLMERIDAKFQIDFHSHGELILYPEGWQVETQATDNPLLEALAGHDENHPAIPGYDPDLAAELYTTNGDITDHALEEFGTQAYTVELTGGFGPPVGGTDGSHPNYIPAGFAFQDSETDVEQVFQENLAFALDLAKSAKDPDDPVSHIGNEAPDFVPNSFTVSHGDPQLVEVNAKKSLGRVKARYRVVETGRSGSVRTSEWQGGLRHGAPGAYYHRMRATLRTGAKPGQTVRVWFTARDERSDSFTYTLASDTGADVLIMAAEDYKGPSSADNSSPYAGPRYLDDYQAALDAAGVSHGSWDTDVTRTAPHPLGIMSHYEAVIWYTGDDLYTRAPGQPGGTGTTKLFDDEVIAAREYMNNGGNLLVTGQFALQGAWDQFLYNPLGPTPPFPNCKTNQTTGQNDADDPVGQEDNCIAVSNDFQQYWLGAYLPIALDTATGLREVEPFGATQFSLDPAGNQHNLYSFLTTSSLLPDYEAFNDEEFGSDRALTTSSGPAFDPPEGAWFMRTADASNGYQRLTRTFDVPALDPGETAELEFKLSYDTEAGYDHVFVEARTAGGDDYRTLPDANGNTTDDTGIGCAESSPYWLDTHPHLRRYITRTQNPDGSFHCEPSQPGIWNADTGNSGGFQDWKIDLSQYAGKSVELSIVYQTDPAFLGIGAFADAVRFTAGGEVLHTAGFEDESLDGWTTPGAHPGSAGNTGDWSRSGSLGYVDGPGISTGHSLLWGFGLEGVQGANERRDIVAHAMEYFGVN